MRSPKPECREGRGDQTIMDIAGHVSKQMRKHYGHFRMEAKRSTLEVIVHKSSTSNESSTSTHKSPHSRAFLRVIGELGGGVSR